MPQNPPSEFWKRFQSSGAICPDLHWAASIHGKRDTRQLIADGEDISPRPNGCPSDYFRAVAFLTNPTHTYRRAFCVKSDMEFTLEMNDAPKIARAVFAVRDDLGFINGWREQLGDDTNPYRKDAVDFAHLAIQRFEADSQIGQPYARSISDFSDHVSHDPQCEVAGFVLLKGNWFPDSNVLGICHFRRTFCNNIVLDYLAGHPFTVRPPEDYQYLIRGIGTALICFLSRVAVSLGCGCIWGEATNLSRRFYRRIFKLDSIEDLILVPQSNFMECAKLDLSWQKTKDATMKSEAVEEIYKAEEANPPLVGNRAVMIGPKRQLVNHFLDLSRVAQDEVLKAIGLFKESDEALSEPDLCTEIFRRAFEGGKLAQLWEEVEKRHEEGDPEKNPFGF